MADANAADHITKKPVVLTLPAMPDVVVRRDVAYQLGTDTPSTMDLYYPPLATTGARLPAVVFVSGGTDAGMKKALGCTFRTMASTTSWARLAAVSGIVGIAYSNREAADVHVVIRHARHHAEQLGLDSSRIGVWASSGNVPMALSVLMKDRELACAVLMYGYMLDWPGSTLVADTLKNWGFANPAAGTSIDKLPAAVPLFIARAGLDHFPHLNTALDKFVADALARNMPLTVVNHATGRHAFDILEDTDAARAVVAQALRFLQRTLIPNP